MNFLPNKETIQVKEDAEATVSVHALADSSYNNADVFIVEMNCDVVGVEPWGISSSQDWGVTPSKWSKATTPAASRSSSSEKKSASFQEQSAVVFENSLRL